MSRDEITQLSLIEGNGNGHGCASCAFGNHERNKLDNTQDDLRRLQVTAQRILREVRDGLSQVNERLDLLSHRIGQVEETCVAMLHMLREIRGHIAPLKDDLD